MNELSETAKSEITRLHSEILEAARTSVDKAIRIGELLTQEKDKLDHGQWLPWLKANVPFTRATAANYMRCWERREELKCKTVLHYLLIISSMLNYYFMDLRIIYSQRLSIFFNSTIRYG